MLTNSTLARNCYGLIFIFLFEYFDYYLFEVIIIFHQYTRIYYAQLFIGSVFLPCLWHAALDYYLFEYNIRSHYGIIYCRFMMPFCFIQKLLVFHQR